MKYLDVEPLYSAKTCTPNRMELPGSTNQIVPKRQRVPKKCAIRVSENEEGDGDGQRMVGTFPKIHPFLYSIKTDIGDRAKLNKTANPSKDALDIADHLLI